MNACILVRLAFVFGIGLFALEDPEKDSKWFEEANKICLIILDKKVDVISRRNLESTFIVNYLRAGHKLYNKE